MSFDDDIGLSVNWGKNVSVIVWVLFLGWCFIRVYGLFSFRVWMISIKFFLRKLLDVKVIFVWFGLNDFVVGVFLELLLRWILMVWEGDLMDVMVFDMV